MSDQIQRDSREMNDPVIEKLLKSTEPSIRYRVLVDVLGEDPQSPQVAGLLEEIRLSPRVALLLSERDEGGEIPFGVYAKWYGAHWVLASLADLRYPPGDKTLALLREQELGWLLGERHQKKIRAIDGRVRRCASQEANALYSLLRLGLADERTEELAERLCRWQWPDGGWNCDKRPKAENSSFMESLIPLRALALHDQLTGSRASQEAAKRAAEVFLKRRLYRSQKDGTIINHHFTKLHYPCYWHYDILFGLVVLAEAGLIGDTRCNDALDLLEAKRLPDGGFPAEAKYYRVTNRRGSGRSTVDWGGTSKRRTNEFVTADALYVLKASGRLA